ncbi:hypothetical protein, partial [Paenibacillus sp. ISL-20]|uniref:hypothetical protein n=1 Tax=Paenibacillus sp. ISL-20 TaxID=2819163 RepID=UPI001BE6F351
GDPVPPKFSFYTLSCIRGIGKNKGVTNCYLTGLVHISDGRNDTYMERLLTARRGPPARSKIFWDGPFTSFH